MNGRAIGSDDIAKVRSSTDIVALIGGHTEIKRVGRQWMARCPLHGERTPSLSVSAEKGVYYCFGCQRSGDAITFVQEIDNLDFVEAVEVLANRAGITLQYSNPADAASYKLKRKLTDAVSRACDFYHKQLLKSSAAGPARAYLRSRGYSSEVVQLYRLGWAPVSKDRNVLIQHLNLAASDWRASGLAVMSQGVLCDFFYKRLLFPISNEHGNPVAFGGRILPKDKGPKYINTSSDAMLYNKSRVLYGLHEHRADIVRKGEAVICEGYTDVIGAAVAGVGNTVATCGVALTEQHVTLLKRFSADKLVLAFDADAAGVLAAERIYVWERKHKLEVLVAHLPEDTDPDDLARSDPEALRIAVQDAVPFLQFRLNRVLARHHMNTAESRARSAAEAAAVVGEHPDPMVRDQYLMSIADRCRVDVKQLRPLAESAVKSVNSRKTTTGSVGVGAARANSQEDFYSYDYAYDADAGAFASDSSRSDMTGDMRTGVGMKSSVGDLSPEDEALRMVIHHPQAIIDRLHISLFGNSTRKEIFHTLQESGSVLDASDRLSEPAAGLLRYLAVDPSGLPASDVLAGLARLAVVRYTRELRYYATHTTEKSLRQEYVSCISWLKQQTELLTEPKTRDAALDVLMPWLVEYGRQLEGEPEVKPAVDSETGSRF
ncbi:MAG: DNA primase [Acidimicrobiaceae bacterium]|nr:DNA primase [Acidimicrobiaceae bacterium]